MERIRTDIICVLCCGVQTVEQLDSAIEGGRFHEAEAFEDYFRFDYLESELGSVRELLAR
ncbi:MAG: hypothetical protein KF753_23445 [Caldilineaceae bacterium]|nr:hypothetical protein [Caldilineaceae bacterium]